MNSRTYYDVLGVSRDATVEEITSAKNALAKVYHPDANMHKDIDTTAFMQEILEAYHVLSDPEKRKAYNQEMFGETTRVFKTFTLGEDDDMEESSSFVMYWNTANQLHEVLRKSMRLIKQESQNKKIPERILKKIGKNKKAEDTFRSRRITELSMKAVRYITVLRMAGIPMEYWNPDAMNWVLIRWGQKQSLDYHVLFNRYDTYINETKSSSEKLRIRNQNRQFHHNLKKLLSYALES